MAVDSIFLNISAIRETLLKIVEGEIINVNVKQIAEANGILNYIETFEFIFLLCFWRDVLSKVYSLSNYLQRSGINIAAAANFIEAAAKDLKNMRNDETFYNFESKAKELSSKCGTTIAFKNSRIRKTKKFHDENALDHVEQCPRQNFKVNVFFVTLDTFILTVTSRFEDFLKINKKFVCLTSEAILKSTEEENINCILALSRFYGKDIIDTEIMVIDEYKNFCSFFKELAKENNVSTEEMLPLIIANDIESTFPNISMLYRIFLTIGTNSGNAERNFSRLKQIKSYARSTMLEERLNDLSILSIEADYAKNIDFNLILDKFKNIKTRRILL